MKTKQQQKSNEEQSFCVVRKKKIHLLYTYIQNLLKQKLQIMQSQKLLLLYLYKINILQANKTKAKK